MPDLSGQGAWGRQMIEEKIELKITFWDLSDSLKDRKDHKSYLKKICESFTLKYPCTVSFLLEK